MSVDDVAITGSTRLATRSTRGDDGRQGQVRPPFPSLPPFLVSFFRHPPTHYLSFPAQLPLATSLTAHQSLCQHGRRYAHPTSGSARSVIILPTAHHLPFRNALHALPCYERRSRRTASRALEVSRPFHLQPICSSSQALNSQADRQGPGLMISTATRCDVDLSSSSRTSTSAPIRHRKS
jgi:hypothetical protein